MGEIFISKNALRLEGQRFVRRNVFLRPIPRGSSHQAMASGREDWEERTTGRERERERERGWESDAGLRSPNSRVFLSLETHSRFAASHRDQAGSGRIRIRPIRQVSPQFRGFHHQPSHG